MNILPSLITSSLSKSCYSHIWELRCICPYLNSKTASTIAVSIVRSKFDYCNSLLQSSLYKSQINCLQQIRNCLACTVVKAHIFSHPVWLKSPPTPPTIISSTYRSEAYHRHLSCPHSLHLSFKDHSNEVQTCVNIHFMLINSPDCFSCLFSWYRLVIMVGGVGGDFSQTLSYHTHLQISALAQG